MAERCWIALGSNVGDRAAYLSSARAALTLLPHTTLRAASTVEETAPFGSAAQGPYLNQMVVLETALAPAALLTCLQRIEASLGRVRRERWGPRTIDLDIVRHGARVVSGASLTLPHPGLATRDFWQREFAELARLLGEAA